MCILETSRSTRHSQKHSASHQTLSIRRTAARDPCLKVCLYIGGIYMFALNALNLLFLPACLDIYHRIIYIYLPISQAPQCILQYGETWPVVWQAGGFFGKRIRSGTLYGAYLWGNCLCLWRSWFVRMNERAYGF